MNGLRRARRADSNRHAGGRRPTLRWILGLGLSSVTLLASCSSAAPATVVPSLPPPTAGETTTSVAPSTTSTTLDEFRDAVHLAVGDDFQSAVDAADEGTVFLIEPGVHRLQEVRPKSGMTFQGLPGAVMNGSIELENWVPEDSNVWSFVGVEETARRHGTCIEGYEGCKYTQDLYMDNVMLWQVSSIGELGPGRWYWEGNTVFVAEDPAARRVELSVATYAFRGDASDVTIGGLVVEKYAVPAQYGAITAAVPGDGPLGSGWVIEESEVRLNHGAGVRLGERTRVSGLFLHHNGQLGITASGGTGSIVEDTEIADNNIAGFKWGWEAGGSKFKETTGLIVRRNDVHDNNGPGLWTDIDNYDTVYEQNRVVDNAGPGIFHEISYDAVINSNFVRANGFSWDPWLWGSGILIAASANVEVHDNTVIDNADGIGGIQQDRGDGPEGPRLLTNLYVHDNTVSVPDGAVGIGEDTGDRSVFTERNNRFESNTYVNMDGRRYLWSGRALDAAGWRNAGQDVDGTWR